MWAITPSSIGRWLLLLLVAVRLRGSDPEEEEVEGKSVPLAPAGPVLALVVLSSEAILIIIANWLRWIPPELDAFKNQFVVVHPQIPLFWVAPLFGIAVVLLNWWTAFRAGWVKAAAAVAGVTALDVLLTLCGPSWLRFELVRIL
jgi:hypothetical protein